MTEIQQQANIETIELVFLPMYGVQNKSREVFAQEVISYTQELYTQGKITLEFLGALLIICNKIVSQETLKKIWKEISMLQVFKYAEEIGKEEGHKEGHKEGREEGRREILREMVLTLLQMKFGEQAASLMPEVVAMSNVADLEALKDFLKMSNDLAKVQKFMAKYCR